MPTPHPTSPGAIAEVLDQMQGGGQLLTTADALAASTGLSLIATKRQLEHLSRQYVRIIGRPTAYLLVPPEYRSRGAPPVTWWLDAYFRLRKQPYYLGLLSAAELHGSSNQAAQLTQVLTTRPIRPILLGKTRVECYVKKQLTSTPLTLLPGMHAPLLVSTPEATALDLITYSHRIGGIGRAAQVIAGLKSKLKVAGLHKALRAEPETATKQRLGYIFDLLGWEKLVVEVAEHLTGRLSVVPLQVHTESAGAPLRHCTPWYVVDNIALHEQIDP